MAAPGRKKGPTPRKKHAPRPAATRPVTTRAAEPRELPRNALGVIGLGVGVLAVVGSPLIVWGVILGVPAAVMGSLSVRRVRRGQATNFRMSVTAIALGSAAVAIAVGLLVYGHYAFSTPAGKRYAHCLDDAGRDKAARKACKVTFDQER